MKVLLILAIALSSTAGFAATCDRNVISAAKARLSAVDSTLQYSALPAPYYFSASLARIDVLGRSAYGVKEYYVDVTINSACRILDVSAVEITGGDQ